MAEIHGECRKQMDVRRPKPRIFTIAQWIWAISAVIGACIFIVAGLNTYRMLACSDWPVADGVITHSEIKRGLMREGALKFQLHLVYQYRVGGQRYDGKRISFAFPTGRREDIHTLLATYPKGRKIRVYYLPNNPKVATLETDVSWKGSKFLIGGLLMIGVGLAGMRQRWSLQTDYLFREQDPDQHVPKWKIVAGSVGLLACLGLFWLWWELIKMYAGR